jgi:hypothetical protein
LGIKDELTLFSIAIAGGVVIIAVSVFFDIIFCST